MTTVFDLIADEWSPWFRRHKWLPGKQQDTWRAWLSFLRVLFGDELSDDDLALFRQCTGRSDTPTGGFREAFLVCGRRSGKSRTLAMTAVFLAVFKDWSPFLVPGERGTVMILSADRRQSRTIFNYCGAFLKALDVETVTVERETMDTLELGNGINIEIGTASSEPLAVTPSSRRCSTKPRSGPTRVRIRIRKSCEHFAVPRLLFRTE
jgi:hypothetical protein